MAKYEGKMIMKQKMVLEGLAWEDLGIGYNDPKEKGAGP